jgi:hypothetical protein
MGASTQRFRLLHGINAARHWLQSTEQDDEAASKIKNSYE